jgi:hypothetical protein
MLWQLVNPLQKSGLKRLSTGGYQVETKLAMRSKTASAKHAKFI